MEGCVADKQQTEKVPELEKCARDVRQIELDCCPDDSVALEMRIRRWREDDYGKI